MLGLLLSLGFRPGLYWKSQSPSHTSSKKYDLDALGCSKVVQALVAYPLMLLLKRNRDLWL
jgi:hypothetical protein